MRISERHAGDATVLDLAGALVAGKADGIIEAAVRRQVRAGRRIVIVNLREVPSIDAAGLGALVVAYTTLRQAGGVLRIAGATKRIHDVMVMTRLTTVFDTFDSVEQAVNDAKLESGSCGLSCRLDSVQLGVDAALRQQHVVGSVFHDF